MARWITLLLGCLVLPAAGAELEWDDLVPEGWQPDAVYNRVLEEVYGDEPVEDLDDEDRKAMQLMDAIDRAWRAAPLKASLDNMQVALPGFGVPLDGDAEFVREFLLVPYFGACIHSPPPPRNQIVLVRMKGKGVPLAVAFDAMWVEGTLKVSSEDTEFGTAGYVLEGVSARAY